MKNDIPNIPNYLHISDPNLLQYNMNFSTSSSISSQDFPGTLRSVFADYFWRTALVAHKNMHISENV